MITTSSATASTAVAVASPSVLIPKRPRMCSVTICSSAGVKSWQIGRWKSASRNGIMNISRVPDVFLRQVGNFFLPLPLIINLSIIYTAMKNSQKTLSKNRKICLNCSHFYEGVDGRPLCNLDDTTVADSHFCMYFKKSL